MVGTGAFSKEFLRTIVRAPGRFLALFAIVALGAGFYAGLRMTAPDMDLALDGYLDDANAYDIRVVSTLGLTADDIEALAGLEGVFQVAPALECDVEAAMNGSTYTMRVHSLNKVAQLDDADSASGIGGADGESPDGPAYMNDLVLAEGRLPEEAGECVICADRVMDVQQQLGDTIEVNMRAGSASTMLAERTLTVVGLARTPYYTSSASMGTSALGSGIVEQYAYVTEDAFARTAPYTEAFITVAGAADRLYGTDEYQAHIDAVASRINDIAPERARLRDENIRDISNLRFYDEVTTYDGALDLFAYLLENPSSKTEALDPCEWLVMDRSKNVGIASFSSDADRVDHIASVFPLVFFLVAALVALTTMTRMVDEERTLIGTYKALGFTRGRITRKYVGYALLASGLGSLVGIVLLGKTLPAVIMNAYAIIYWVPDAGFPLDVRLSLMAALLSMGITLVATWASVTATLRERPAALMLPPAPKTGQRILLEHVVPLWERLSFTWKVTCRNLFRYKKRLVMTLIGIAGCTALLLTGLGLRDAINDIIDIHFTEIVRYNAVITVDGNAEPAEREAFEALMGDGDLVQASTPASATTMLASGPRADGKRVELIVPQDPDAFADTMTLRTRVGHEQLALQDGQVVINEKLAIELGVKPGDAITLAEQDAMGNATQTTYEYTVAGTCEAYVYNYVFANAATYESVMGEAPGFNTYYASVTDDPQQREQLDKRLSSLAAVKTASYNDEVIKTYRTMLRSVDLIVVVLVVSAATLAFIVLYNLTNINIEERIREIATLKVLGFTRRETNAYVFREVALLSIIGCLMGLALGVPLESFVVTTAEVDQVMFGRAVHAASFVGAFLLTLLFSAASMALMLPKLARIDMVESLKSNE